MKISVAIADDQMLFLEGISSLLKENENLVLKFKASNGVELYEKFARLKKPVDVLLLDIKMPQMDGVEVLKRLKATRPEVRTIILSMYDDDSILQRLIELGAKGFLSKDADFETVVDAIYKVHAGDIFFTEEVSKRLIKRMAVGGEQTYLETRLTTTEIEVVKLLCKEYSTKEIGELMNISDRTVESHKHNIFRKTGAKNLAGVVAFAFRNRIVS